MPVSCLVCGRPTSATHMGLDACRACTVFYRRNRGIGDQFLCIDGKYACMDFGRNELSCRKCRLDRFEALLTAASEESLSNLSIFSEHSLKTQNQSASNSSMLELIRINHDTLSTTRLIGELALRGISVDPLLVHDVKYEIIPCTYRYMNEGTKVLVSGLCDFILATFPEFRNLENSEKWLLIRNYQKIFHIIDAELRALREFGKASFHTFGTYTTFLSPEYAEHYFSDCPDQSNLQAAAKTLRECIQGNIPPTQKHIYQIDPTDCEFIALIGLALWSVENLEVSDRLLAMAASYRTTIIAELTEQYRSTLDEESAAGRIGVLLCLQDFPRVEGNLKSEYEIYRMLDVFDDETLMYKLQTHLAESSS